MIVTPISEELLADLLEGEKAYPIHRITIKWSQDIGDRDTTDYAPSWFEGLPAGRLWEQSNWFELPNSFDLIPAILTEAEKIQWPKLLEKRDEIVNPSDLKVTAEFQRWETWCGGKFQHWTWEIGLDDLVVLRSFGRFVDRMQRLNRKEGEMKNGYWQDVYCLMGAEDHWRWSGAKDADGNPTEPPCRCEHCVKRGVVNIDH